MAEPRAGTVFVFSCRWSSSSSGGLQVPLDGRVDVGNPQGDVGPTGSCRPVDVFRLADRVRFRSITSPYQLFPLADGLVRPDVHTITGTFARVRRSARSGRCDAHEVLDVEVGGGRGVARGRLSRWRFRPHRPRWRCPRVRRSLVGAFTSPTAVKVLPGGDLLVLEKPGTLQRVAGERQRSIGRDDRRCAGDGERGLLSAALDPRSLRPGTIYVYASRSQVPGLRQHVVEVHDERRRSPASEQVLVDNIVWSATNHNGGTVEVGRDGFLYLSVGEGADTSRAQNLESLGGKILRITTTGQPAPGNPFLTQRATVRARGGQSAAACEEIYALGLRNPFRTAFDPNSTTTRFRINDVGREPGRRSTTAVGANYGWAPGRGRARTARPLAARPTRISPIR